MPFPQKMMRMVQYFGSAGFPLGRSAIKAVPKGAAYLNIGQLGLAVPMFYKWLDQRPDITCAMMLHDAIPLEFPNLVPAGAEAHHKRMILTAAKRADCLIFNSAFSRNSVNQAMHRLAGIQLPGMVRALPIPAAFIDVKASLPELADAHYFVIVSTIEPRKNHALLLRIWTRLIDQLGVHAPHLVIVGSFGYNARNILSPLDQRPDLRQRVHVVSGLSSPALAALVLGASGMLSPSFTEGFGLPVLEACALGVPTIASDIPAHREVGDEASIFLPCEDEDAWKMAICTLPPVRQRRRPAIHRQLSEASYCADVLNFVRSVLPAQ